MKATMVILPTLEEQLAAGDDTVIDPQKLIVEEGKSGPVFINGSYEVRSIGGEWTNMRVEEGRLVADIELNDAGEKLNHFSPAAMRSPTGESRLIAVHGYYAPCKDETPDDDCEDET